MANSGFVTLPIGFARATNTPITNDQVFSSKAAADEFVAGKTSYLGEIISVVDGGTVTAYIVKGTEESKELVEIGKAPITDYSALENKPAIDGVTLDSTSTAEGLGLAKKTDIPDVSGYQTADQVSTAVSSAITALGNIFRLKGRVDDIEALNAIDDAVAGDVYLVGAGGDSQFDEYVRTDAGAWEHIGHPDIDLSNYATKEDLNSYQPKLTETQSTALANAEKIKVDSDETAKSQYLGRDGIYHDVPKIEGTEISADYDKLINRPSINGTTVADDVEMSAATVPMDYNVPSGSLDSEGNLFKVNIGGGSIGGLADGTGIKPTDSVLDILKKILTKKVSPTYTRPTATLSLTTGTQNVEVGSTQAITIHPNIAQNDAGTVKTYTLKQGSTTLIDGVTAVQDYTNSSFKVTLGTTTYTATVVFNEGTTKKNNLGEEDATGKFGEVTLTPSLNIRGYRKVFYKTGDEDQIRTTSEGIRDMDSKLLTGANSGKGTKIELNTSGSPKHITIAYPASLGDITEIKSKSLGYDVKGGFSTATVQVADASGSEESKVEYKVYYIDVDGGYVDNGLTVTL